MDPGDEGGRPTTDRPADNNLDVATVAPEYDRASRLAQRRRSSRELDDLLAPEPAVVHCPCCRLSAEIGQNLADFWHVTGMDLGVPEREYAGRELAAAGWCP